ncbi:MAG: hypothetical protein HQ564_07035 [Candidatus Saganbacteria bacterium]|nr:hypothetical protein [Candidatus Saganbacteria bacterium]
MNRITFIAIAIILQFLFIIKYLKGVTGLLIGSIYGFTFAVLAAHFFAPQYMMRIFWWGAGIFIIVIPLYYLWYYIIKKEKTK